MNCLEKMYHNHLPLNAFTSRFPNARAKAMLTLMLDGHRQECDSCDKILDDANVGIFHGDEQKLKMDLGKGPSLNDVRSLGARGVGENLTLLNKIFKFYTIKI